jgi:acyl-homoserine-lactone acylase
VKPKVITRFEPWMALSFTEGSIGGDVERISLGELEAFYGQAATAGLGRGEGARVRPGRGFREPTGSNGFAIAPSNTRTATPCC